MEKKKYYRYENDSEGSNKFTIKEKLLYGANINCFTTQKEAETHFKQANKIALKKYKDIINGINKLKKSLGDFSYSYYMLGDTYGIYEDGMYIEFEVNGYNFKFSQSGE